MKVAICKSGSFVLSEDAIKMLIDTGRFNENDDFDFQTDEERTNTDLIHVIETLGDEATEGWDNYIHIVEIPDDVEWYISHEITGSEEEYEIIREKHRTWK